VIQEDPVNIGAQLPVEYINLIFTPQSGGQTSSFRSFDSTSGLNFKRFRKVIPIPLSNVSTSNNITLANSPNDSTLAHKPPVKNFVPFEWNASSRLSSDVPFLNGENTTVNGDRQQNGDIDEDEVIPIGKEGFEFIRLVTLLSLA